MKFLKPTVIIILIVWVQNVLAQSNPGNIGPSSYEVQLVPANPDVADLGKFGDIPINKYNGTANVSIPIHSVELDGLQIPIQLAYNTGGIKVNQDASWVGLGWNLSDGIVITREVNDFEDIKDQSFGHDHVGWLFSEDKLFPTEPDYLFELDAEELFELDLEYAVYTPDDLKPDLFSLNVPSGSVKFYLPKIEASETQLVASVIGEKNYEVLYDINAMSFEVTDPSGFKYFFDQKEYSTSYSSINENPTSDDASALNHVPTVAKPQSLDMISSWKVTKIQSPHYDEVANSSAELNFTYDQGFFLSFPHFSETYDLNVTSNTVDHAITTPSDVTATLTAFKVSYLEEISGDFGAVRFVLGDRSDLFTEQAMESFRGGIWNLVGVEDYQKKVDMVQIVDPNNQIIKTANLGYTYFNQDEYSSDVNGDRKYIRLKLDSVTINDRIYSFEYESPDALPAKNSKSIDFWGFYNGIGNSIRIPTFNRFFFITPASIADNYLVNEKFVKLSGVSRQSDANYGKYGVLKKVTYPTGGFTEFTYEGNTVALKRQTYTPAYRDNGVFRSSGLSSSEAYDFRYQQLKLANDTNYSLEDHAYIECAVGTTSVGSSGSSFTITESNLCDGESYNIEISATLHCSVGCNQGISPTGRAVWVKNLDSGTETTVFSYDSQFSVNSTLVDLGPKRLNLPVGNYMFHFSSWSVSTPFLVVATANASAIVRHDASIDPPADVYDEFEVGGLRLQKITNRDSNGKVIGSKEFGYDTTLENSSTGSSGVLMDDLVFWSSEGSLFEYAPDVGVSGDSKFRISSDNKLRTKNAASGSHIGYSLVSESVVNSNGNDNGKTISKFINIPNEYIKRNVGTTQFNLGTGQCPSYTNPYLVIENPGIDCFDHDDLAYGEVYILGESPVNYAHINGSISEELIYDSVDLLKQKTENIYHDFDIGYMPFAKYPVMCRVKNSFLFTEPYVMISDFDLGHRKAKRLINSTVETYLGNDTLVTSTEFFYDQPDHYQLNKTIILNSNGEVNTVKVHYPQDLDVSLLTDNHRFNEVVKSETFLGTEANPEEKQLQSQEKVFSNSQDFNGLVLPSEVITLKGVEDLTSGSPNNEPEQRQIYEYYDERGNLLQYRKAIGTPVTYLWGYNKIYPVAKIEHLEYDDISSSLLNAIINSSNLDDDRTVDLIDTNGNKTYQGNEGGLRNQLDLLRQAFPEAMVTTYTYDPLIGVTSITDPRGNTVYYHYDDSNRLKEVRDEDGNLLKDYEYNYKDQ